VLGYVVYSALPGFCRADVMTREVTDADDLSVALMSNDATARRAPFEATAQLVRSLSNAGARHHDLNVKNVLLQRAAPSLRAWVLDVDRVTFDADPTTALDANLARLVRSMRKWRDVRGAPITDADVDALIASVRRAGGAPARAHTP
jgi:3-deoxy-D-manno-octulosonic acid kinase